MGILDDAVVDSSVIIARYVSEQHSIWAKNKMTEYGLFHILDLSYYEVANVLRHMAPKKLTIEESRATFFEAKRLMNIFTLHNFSWVIDDAYALAVKLDIAVYDAAFVFLADRLGVRLLTLDKELVKKVEGTKFSNLLEYPNK